MKYSLATLAFVAAAAHAAVVPVHRVRNKPDNVLITNPTFNTVWQVGETYTVTWARSKLQSANGADDLVRDVYSVRRSYGDDAGNDLLDVVDLSDAPSYNARRAYSDGVSDAAATPRVGSLFLYPRGCPYGYPLATDVDLSKGAQDVTVPSNITVGDEYRLILFSLAPKDANDPSVLDLLSHHSSSSPSADEDVYPSGASDADSDWGLAKLLWLVTKKDSTTVAYSPQFAIDGATVDYPL